MNKKQRDELDALIQKYYRDQSVDEDRVDAILHRPARQGTGRRAGLPENPQGRRWTRRQWLQAAAIGGVLLVGGVTVRQQVYQSGTREMLLNELALNHREAFELDVATDSFATVQDALGRLNFEVQAPANLVAGYELLGGRYCSILGKLAVQLKLREPASRRVDTLFLTPLTGKLGKIQPQRASVDDIAITLGSSGDLFYGHTRQIDP